MRRYLTCYLLRCVMSVSDIAFAGARASSKRPRYQDPVCDYREMMSDAEVGCVAAQDIVTAKASEVEMLEGHNSGLRKDNQVWSLCCARAGPRLVLRRKNGPRFLPTDARY